MSEFEPQAAQKRKISRIFLRFLCFFVARDFEARIQAARKTNVSRVTLPLLEKFF
jgi:hypothetical protein